MKNVTRAIKKTVKELVTLVELAEAEQREESLKQLREWRNQISSNEDESEKKEDDEEEDEEKKEDDDDEEEEKNNNNNNNEKKEVAGKKMDDNVQNELARELEMLLGANRRMGGGPLVGRGRAAPNLLQPTVVRDNDRLKRENSLPPVAGAGRGRGRGRGALRPSMQISNPINQPNARNGMSQEEQLFVDSFIKIRKERAMGPKGRRAPTTRRTIYKI